MTYEKAVQTVDGYIEAYAEVYDAFLFSGCGDALREAWIDLRPLIFPPLCDCAMDPYHRWNCSLTPLWAQTIQDLDANPWTVVTNAGIA